MVAEAMLEASQLAEAGIDVRVIDMHTIKPLDENIIIEAAKETGRIVTCLLYTSVCVGFHGAGPDADLSAEVGDQAPSDLHRSGKRRENDTDF